MRRLSFRALRLLIAIFAIISAPGSAIAQPATSTVEDQMLRIATDTYWTFVETDLGSAVDEYDQMIDGEPQFDLWPPTQALYEQHQVQSVRVYSAQLRPQRSNFDAVATSVEIRIYTFPDADNSASFLSGVVEFNIEDDANDDTVDWQIAPVDPLPASTFPVEGYTGQEMYHLPNGDETGNASLVRYLAQIDNVVVSALVSGPLVDFNFDLAYMLLQAQAACVLDDTPCDPVSVSEITPSWGFVMTSMYFYDENQESHDVRWIFPVDKPVRAPEHSATLGAT